MYAREMTEVSKSALLELGLSLKRYHDDIVLTGGWAPYFISKGYFEHCGSIDIDLAIVTSKKELPDLSTYEEKLKKKISIHLVKDAKKEDAGFINSLC